MDKNKRSKKAKIVQLVLNQNEMFGLTSTGEVWVYINCECAGRTDDKKPGWVRLAGDDYVRAGEG